MALRSLEAFKLLMVTLKRFERIVREQDLHNAEKVFTPAYFLLLLSKVELVAVDIEIENPLNWQLRMLMEDPTIRGTIGKVWELELPDILGLGIYASLSKLNHSCTPNLEVEYADSNVARVRLLKPVLEDEQATIAYIDEAMTLSNRRKALLENYNFTCYCPKCIEEEQLIMEDEASSSASFDRFLDVLVAERIFDVNHGDLMSRLVDRIKESSRLSQLTPFGSQSAAAAIFLKASLHKDSYRKCGVKPIFTPKETQKYLQQRHTIVDWFKRVKSAPGRRESDPQSTVDGLTCIMRYIQDVKDPKPYERDDHWNRIITGDDVKFSDSDGDSPKSSSVTDVGTASGGSTGSDVVESPDWPTQEATLPNNNSTTIELQVEGNGRNAHNCGVISQTTGMHSGNGSHISREISNADATTCDSTSNIPYWKADQAIYPLNVDKPMNGVDPGVMAGGEHPKSAGFPIASESSKCDDMVSEDVSMLSTSDELSSVPDNLAGEGYTQVSVDQSQEVSYYINPTVIFYGYSNLVTQCYYFIRNVLDKPTSELVAYPEHLRSRHAFLLWQNPCLQHICCKELSFAFSNNEITFGKLSEILLNKKSKCCVLENIDMLPKEVQVKIAKYLHKNERLFILLTRRLSHVVDSLRGIAFSFRVPSINVNLLVQAATSQKFSPNIFAGLSKNSINEHVHRAREDIHCFYHTMVALQHKRTVSIRRDTIHLKRIVHCIRFQEDSMSSKMLIKKSIQGFLPLYMRDQFMFWMDLLDEIQATCRPQLPQAKEMIYHLIAQKSATLSRVSDPRVTLEVIFQKMRHIVNSGCNDRSE
ncbi:hypothetical protein X943_000258 [Babesia divergens]|uniref:SET domain-containing protein n=1 Tax=Babesia divergens TaxID=32595 RepID=A0AAD9G6E9_BABDI|nr:hypothetical protein X943_000258 [Babesia divergens]